MTEKPKGPEFLRIRISGAVTENTLYALMNFPSRLIDPNMIRWRSLKDDDLVHAFTPYLASAKRLYLVKKRFDESMIDEALKFNLDGIRMAGGSLVLPNFDEKSTEEAQRAILQLEANKHRLALGEKLPKYKLTAPESTRPSIIKGRVIRVGIHGHIIHPEQFAPIPDVTSQLVIASIIGYPDETTPKRLTSDEIKRVEDNIEVLNTLFGTDLDIQTYLDRSF